MVIKTIAMLGIYLVPFGFLFVDGLDSWVYFLCWVLMGVGMAGCGLSIMHDANHSAYSRNETINKAIGNVLILLGGSAVNWKIQHNVLHHTFTNVTHLDEDIDPPAFLLRFTPHKKRYAAHKFQHLYAWFFYGMMTMMWFSTKDFKQAKRYKEKDLIKTQGTTYARHMSFIILFKIIYVGLFIVCPFMLSPASWVLTLSGFVTMHFIAGFILSIGMAVDANILIFERLKEEIRKGKSISQSIDDGFARAWLSIRDSNVSSLITTFILYIFGTPAIRGFAVTLGIGVIISMFTAITITRTFLKLFVGNSILSHPWLFGVSVKKVDDQQPSA